MDVQVKGTTMPVLEVVLAPGERIVAEAGELSWMTSSIQLRTSTQMAGSAGLLGAFKRAVGGGGLFMTEYTAQGWQGMIAFATKLPGQIQHIRVEPDRAYLVHRHGFLCATPGVELSLGFQRRLGAGVFGGTGFVLQRVAGSADAWIELDGEVFSYDLTPNDVLRVHPGHVGMFEEQVRFDITTVPGIANKLFGGDGLFLATLTGPGRVWLQSLTLSNLAHALRHYLVREEAGAAAAGGIAGAALKGIFRD
jgi:uncharacterized protein (TIGR00266 family)